MDAQNLPNLKFNAGDIIFREGDSPNGLFVIRSGRVELQHGGTLLDTLGKNAFFGEMALVDNRPRSATAIAIDETECLRVSSADFQKRVMKLDPLMQGILRVMVERMRVLNDRLEEYDK